MEHSKTHGLPLLLPPLQVGMASYTIGEFTTALSVLDDQGLVGLGPAREFRNRRVKLRVREGVRRRVSAEPSLQCVGWQQFTARHQGWVGLGHHPPGGCNRPSALRYAPYCLVGQVAWIHALQKPQPFFTPHPVFLSSFLPPRCPRTTSSWPWRTSRSSSAWWAPTRSEERPWASAGPSLVRHLVWAIKPGRQSPRH